MLEKIATAEAESSVATCSSGEAQDDRALTAVGIETSSVVTEVEYALLKRFCRREKIREAEDDQTPSYSKLDVHFGAAWPALIRDRIVVDFGSGFGNEMIQMARRGAAMVYGLEVSESQLREAGRRIAQSGVAERCRLIRSVPDESADCVFSFDSFEHFADPAGILGAMRSMLKPGGRLYISFGPTWFHPLGGHAFSPFPWAHVLLSERALVRWRNLYYPGRSVGFEQSGLNRMTIRRFFSICEQSGLHIERREAIPIRRLRPLHTRFTSEWTTSVVRAILRK